MRWEDSGGASRLYVVDLLHPQRAEVREAHVLSTFCDIFKLLCTTPACGRAVEACHPRIGEFNSSKELTHIQEPVRNQPKHAQGTFRTLVSDLANPPTRQGRLFRSTPRRLPSPLAPCRDDGFFRASRQAAAMRRPRYGSTFFGCGVEAVAMRRKSLIRARCKISCG